MKLATFLKSKEYDIVFHKGCSPELRDEFEWDYIFVTSLFTFEWKRTVETIKYYSLAKGNPKIFCGGILASLMPRQLEKETGVTVVEGLLDHSGTIGIRGEEAIEYCVPDYSILDEIDYKYPTADSYFVHFTRGCVNKCKFCAVPRLEPIYEDYRTASSQIKQIIELYGEKQNLLIMDNNSVASNCFSNIVDDIKDLGFYKGAKINGKKRVVDFNQGLDARHMTEEKMKLLSSLAIKPLRVAFDNIALHEPYERSMRWAAKYGLTQLSNYVLYNYLDTPEDFYERLRINIDLNEELGTSIFSFPMKYSPINQTDRKYIGKNWNWRYLRGVKCILQATHGVVGTQKEFFFHAFGESAEEFKEILSMPERYIIERVNHESISIPWRQSLRDLSVQMRQDFDSRILDQRYPNLGSNFPEVEELLVHY